MSIRFGHGATVALLAALAATGGCGGKGKEAAAPAARPPVAGVSTELATSGSRDAFVELIGTVRAKNSATVAPQAMGRILSMPVTEGMRVAAGAVIAVIDDGALRAQRAAAEGAVSEAKAAKAEVERAIGQAQAGRDLAERTFSRYAKLHEERVITPQEFDEIATRRTLAIREQERVVEKRAQVEAKILQAQEQLRAIDAQLAWSRVTAPFSGVVVEKKADAGGMAVPGMPLVVLEDTRAFRIEAAVPESQLAWVRVGTKVDVTLDAYPGKAIPATVSEIVPSVDPGSRTFTVKASLSATDLRTGMFGRVRLPAGRTTAVTLPQSAVVSRGGFEAVFVVSKDNVARLAVVRTGAVSGGRVEILSGIGEGDRVAVTNVDRLTDGATVGASK
jgi:RND family efflux transporter MFP subunit